MVEFRPWLGAGILLVVSMQTVAAIPTAAKRATSTTTGITSHLAVFGISQATTSSSVPVAPGRLDNTLTAVAQAYPSISTSDHPIAGLHSVNPAAHFRISTPTTTPEVLVDVITKGDPQNLKAELTSLGMRDIAVFSNDVGGWLPVDQLANASALADLHFARAAMPRTRSSAVATQGDFAQMSSTVRTSNPGLTGSGVTIGVLSDSFNCFAQYGASGSGVPASGYNGYAPFGFTATYANDQTPSSGQVAATAALPGNVTILEEANCMEYGAPYQLPFTDEGRAILQIVHSVAPGASLAFYTAENSEADFATGITKLAAAGARIIDDDVGYPDEPFFQDGIVAQAIDTVAAEGVAYFSSAGNNGNVSYENTTPSFSVTGSGSQSNEKLLNFDPSGASTTTSLPVSIPKLAPGEYVPIVVEWDSPYVTGAANSGGSTASMDICVSGNSSDLLTDFNSFPSAVTCTGGSGTGKDPVQIILIGNPANASAYSAAESVNVTLGLVNGTTAPGRVKLVVEADGAAAAIDSPFSTNSPTLQGHPGAAGAAAVGAAFYFNTPQCGASAPTLESFSSLAGDPILFDTTGTRLATPTIRNKPDFVAPDGVNNTMLGASLNDGAPTGVNVTAVNATSIAGCQDNESFPSFFGTSAAAPHAAAAAALMLQAAPTMTAAQIISTLQSTAIAMTSASSSGTYDYLDGHGFIDVNAAFAGITVDVASLSVSPNTITLGSSAALTWSSTNVSSCTASGSWTGTQKVSGSQSVTPTSVGTEAFTLTCTTTAGGTVTSSANLQTTAAPSSSSSSSSSSTKGFGRGALDPTTLLALGGVLLAGCARRRRQA